MSSRTDETEEGRDRPADPGSEAETSFTSQEADPPTDAPTKPPTGLTDAAVTAPVEVGGPPSTPGEPKAKRPSPDSVTRARDSEADLIFAARMQAQRRSAPVMRGIGGRIPGYTIIRELHRGGQGVVYLATQEGTGRQVAVKVMREGPFASANDRVRFDREVRVLAQLNYPNIVAIHDSGSVGDSFYYVMDFIPGLSLDDYVREHKPSVREVLSLFATICNAVNAAHLRGVIHRDLKPSNIRVTPQGVPHVLDFGLAKVSENATMPADTMPTQMTMTGQFIGSLPWASPEQARGESNKIDVRTDVYSLGVILFQLLCGRFPYDIDGPMRDVMDNICEVQPLRPRKLASGVNSELETLILKPLDKEREHRYQNAGEFARDIERFLAGEPIEAKSGNRRYLIKKLLQRSWAIVTAAAIALVALLTIVVSLWMGYQDLSQTRQGWSIERQSLEDSVDRLRRENERLKRERDAAVELIGKPPSGESE